MALYLMNEKYSNAAYKGMVDTPQDRAAAAHKLADALEMKMHQIYFSVSSAEIVFIVEAEADKVAALEMIGMSTSSFTSFEALEIIDSKSMTAAMETANKVVSAYQAPNK